MPNKNSSPSFLIIHVTRIGDTIMGSAAIRAVARAFPNSEITCLGHPKRYIILKLPFVNHLGAITKNRAPWLDRLSGRRFDYALVYGFDTALVKYALRLSKHVIAFRQRDEALNKQLYQVVEPPAVGSMPGVKQLLLLPEVLDIQPDGFYLSYHVEETERAWAINKLRTLFSESARPIVGLQIQSFPTKPYRDWPVTSFIALCKKIMNSYNKAQILLLGGPLNQSKIAPFKTALGDKLHVLAGTLSLRESAAVMEQLDLYVGVDTGPTHIAGALNIPMIALYHCLHPSRCLQPLENSHVHVIDLPVIDAECSSEKNMSLIGVDAVWNKVQSALNTDPKKAAIAYAAGVQI